MPDAIDAAREIMRASDSWPSRAGTGRPITLAHPCDYLDGRNPAQAAQYDVTGHG